MIRVHGFCPVCGSGLRLVDDEDRPMWEVRCVNDACPRPRAAGEILADAETEHVVTLWPSNFLVRHPLRERLDNALDSCSLAAWLANEPEPPFELGRYRVTWRGVGHLAPGEWERLP